MNPLFPFPPKRTYYQPPHPLPFALHAGYRRSDDTAFFQVGQRGFDFEEYFAWSWAFYYLQFGEPLFDELTAAPEKGKFFTSFCRRWFNKHDGKTYRKAENQVPAGTWANTGLTRHKKRPWFECAGYGNVDGNIWPTDLDKEWYHNLSSITR